MIKQAKFSFRAIGTYALMQSNPQSMTPDTGGRTVKKIPKKEDEAESKVYRLPSGQIYHPANGFLSAMIKGGVGWKVKNRSLTSILKAALFLSPVHDVLELGISAAPLFRPETEEPITEYEIDVRRVVLQSGAAVLRARPRIWPWAADLHFVYDVDQLGSTELLLDAAERAGFSIGVGENRPGAPKGMPGPFGRFVVEVLD